jgi:hypothetical protein
MEVSGQLHAPASLPPGEPVSKDQYFVKRDITCLAWRNSFPGTCNWYSSLKARGHVALKTEWSICEREERLRHKVPPVISVANGDKFVASWFPLLAIGVCLHTHMIMCHKQWTVSSIWLWWPQGSAGRNEQSQDEPPPPPLWLPHSSKLVKYRHTGTSFCAGPYSCWKVLLLLLHFW